MNHSNEALVDRLYLHHAKSGTTRHVDATGYAICARRNGRTCVHALRVVKGSRAAKKAQKGFLNHKEYVRIREDLIENGTLIDQGNFYEFTRGNCSDLRGSAAFPTGCGRVAKHGICFASRPRPLKREQLPQEIIPSDQHQQRHASCVMRADSSNGPLQWKRTSDGKALREILREIDGQEYAAAA